MSILIQPGVVTTQVPIATETTLGLVKLSAAAADTLNPKVASSGTVFPSAPVDGQKFNREDLGTGWTYDDTLHAWLGPEYAILGVTGLGPITVGGRVCRRYLGNSLIPGYYITRWEICTILGITNDEFAYWGVYLGYNDDGVSNGSPVHSFDTSADLASAKTMRSIAHGTFSGTDAVIGTDKIELYVRAAILAGAPTPIDILTSVYARDARTS